MGTEQILSTKQTSRGHSGLCSRHLVQVALLASMTLIVYTIGSGQTHIDIQRESATVFSPDTVFSFRARGAVDSYVTRRYRPESIVSHEGVPLGMGTESTIALIMRNDGPALLTNPQIEINGKRFLYSFTDWLREIPLRGLRSVDDTIRAVNAYLTSHYYHWLVSTKPDDWQIDPLKWYNVFGSGHCDNNAQVFVSIMRRLGYDARVRNIGSGSHTIGILMGGGGREIPLDADIQVMYPRRGTDSLASIGELMNDQDLVRRQHHFGLSAPISGYDDAIARLYGHRLKQEALAGGFGMDSLVLTLRPEERVEFLFDRLPGSAYHFLHGNRSYNVAPPAAPPAARLGRHVYAPSTLDRMVRFLADSSNLVVMPTSAGQAFAAADPSLPSTFTISLSSPFALTAGSVHFRFEVPAADSTASIRVLISKYEPNAFVEVYRAENGLSGAVHDSVAIGEVLRPIGTPITNTVFVRFEMGGAARVCSVAVIGDFQFNPNAVPRCAAGENSCRVFSTDGNALNGLSVALDMMVYESPILPDPVANPVYPARGGVIPAVSSVTFRWVPPVGAPTIADWNVQVSDREDSLLVVSPSFDILTSLGNLHGSTTECKFPIAGMLIPGKRYFWRVAYRSDDGVWSGWSTPSEFSIEGPGIIVNPHITSGSPVPAILWEANPQGSTPVWYRLYGSTVSGASLDDCVLLDSITVPRFTLDPSHGFVTWPFFRVVAVDAHGRISGPSDQISNTARRVYAQAPALAQSGDTISIAVVAIEPHYRYGNPVIEFKDSLTLSVHSTTGPWLRTANGFKGTVLPADSLVVIQATSTDSETDYSLPLHLDVNGPPVLSFHSTLAATEDQPYTLLIECLDPEADATSLEFTGLPPWLQRDGSEWKATGTPGLRDIGTAQIAYVLRDTRGGQTVGTLAVVVAHVNHKPFFPAYGPIRAREDEFLRASIMGADADTVIGDRLHYRIVSGPAWLQIDSASGTIEGIPSAAEVGTTSFTMEVRDDSGATSRLTLPITIAHRNHAPILSAVDVGVAVEDTPWQMVMYAFDPDSALFGDRIQYSILPSSSWLSVDQRTGLVQGVPSIRHLIDSLFVVVAIDDSGATDSLSLTIPIRHVNHNPYFGSIAKIDAAEDSVFQISLHASDRDTLVGDRLHYRMIFGPAWLTLDSLKGFASGAPGADDVGSGELTVIAIDDSGASATLVLPYTVRHTNHPPQITGPSSLIAVEDSLFASRVIAEDVDVARFGDTLRFTALQMPAWLTMDPFTGALSGIPGAGQVSAGTLAVIVTDGKGGSASLSIPLSVTHTNHAPVFATLPEKNSGAIEDAPFTMDCSATDGDTPFYGDSLTYALTVHPRWLHIDRRSGTVSGTPNEDDHDTTFTVVASDGVASATLTVVLPVQQVNDPPAISGDLRLTIPEDSSATLDLMHFVNDPDDPQESLQWGAFSTIDGADFYFCGAPPDDGQMLHTGPDSLVIFLDTTSARVYVQAMRNFNGSGLPIVINVRDPEGLVATDTLIVNVTPVNDPPVLSAFPAIAVAEDDTVLITPATLGALAEDPDDADSLLVWSCSGSRTGVPTVSAHGIGISFPPEWHGIDSVTVSVMDGAGCVDSIRVAVHVIPVNDAPVVAHVPDVLVRADSSVSFSLAPFVTDADDQVANLRAWVSPLEPSGDDPPAVVGTGSGKVLPAGSIHCAVDSQLNVTIAINGRYPWTHLPLLVRALDPQGGAGFDTIMVSVVPPLAAPVIEAVADTCITSGQPFTMRVRVRSAHGDTGKFIYRLEGPAWLSIDSTGTLRGVPPGDADDSVLVIVADDRGASDSLRFWIRTRTAAAREIPADYVMSQNYPNPFNPATTIRFGLPEPSRVTAEVFNILGQRVAIILSSDLQEGYHTVAWSPVNLASGAYIVVLEAHGLVSPGRDARLIKKVTLVR